MLEPHPICTFSRNSVFNVRIVEVRIGYFLVLWRSAAAGKQHTCNSSCYVLGFPKDCPLGTPNMFYDDNFNDCIECRDDGDCETQKGRHAIERPKSVRSVWMTQHAQILLRL